MILIKNTQRKVKIDTDALKKDTQASLDYLDYHDFDIGILLTNNITIHEYNRTYRNKDTPTDILSFPNYPDLKAGQRIVATTDEEKNLGDLILSPEYIEHAAKKLGIPFKHRLRRLLVHGICHLLGYDHIEDTDYKEMLRVEISLLRHLANIDKKSIKNQSLRNLKKHVK